MKNDLYKRCRRLGFHWLFHFSENMLDGDAVTVVKEKLLRRTKGGLETIISHYHGGREDATALAISEAIGSLKAMAYSQEVAVNEINGRDGDELIIDAALDSDLVQRFLQDLGDIHRVVITQERMVFK